MELNRKNYFSPEAEKLYLGSTSFKNFDKYHAGGCEAREVAKREGEWTDKVNPAFLLGNYLHSWSSGDLQEFIANTPELFKKDGTLLKQYAVGDTMINVFKNDLAMAQMREGQKEQIFTGEIANVPFKIQVDILNIEKGYFADIKTTKNIHEMYWNNETRERETFIEKYDYPLQFAIYAEILRQNLKMDKYLDCYILAVDKQEVPDHEIIYMDVDGFIKEKLEEVESKLPHIVAVRNGEIEPERCEECDYCRSTKKIVKPIHWLDLGA
ncbi:hypothetical protein Ga0466249_002218 [Sporomusaceae bacterium BoRhaA]|uniref:PD-(D/E)XK nuclease-like domain-containing protein n=1 Tax=Pelorhabdus rhamnosifermentans TaxID=2772457 RepID=UPI001C05EEE3|nr:PD-(D/E)XK nuclease-like domain-containing protein [Pelorhabdus rhamnosifermentans]MBU2701107.1 hypothetical protein [Pelorhabdus rhamnosifermentans]